MDQSSDQICSDLNTAVYTAVQAAGMSFPFPQREVRLLGAFAGGAEDVDQARGSASG